MPNKALAETLIQRALNLFETSACWDKKAAMKCHMVGLQAEKRRLRYLARKAQNVIDSLQHSGWDIFDPGLELYPVAGVGDVSAMNDPETCMRKIIDTFWTIHDSAHEIANEMVIGKLKGLSEPIFCFCECLMDLISEVQRKYRSYEASGWNWMHISKDQETQNNTHDEYEEKEEAQGYKDRKEA